jgi:hypothetical protein
METMTDPQIKKIERTAERDGENSHQDRDIAERFKDIPGWGMDADPENDPTYPMKHYNGADHQRLNYERPPQQPIDREVLKSIERPTITRVFGTSVPPKGLSGSIRRFAYDKYSENHPAHWMTLILADKINVVEGVIDDFRNGIVPNLWVEKGWRSEWKTNRGGVVKKATVAALAATAVILIMTRKRKRSLSL